MAGLVVPQSFDSKTKELKGTEKRDTLRVWEIECHNRWEQEKLFEADAPTTEDVPFNSISAAELRDKYPKWFGCYAYPYMNGVLHIGHSFTISKVEFTAGFERMKASAAGRKRVLWPQGYHCTGLPIKACADKLVEEVKMFGQEFEDYREEAVAEPAPKEPAPAKSKREDVTKFTATKGKAAAKKVAAKYQFQIMQTMGIPKQEIHRFADPQYWLTYFPPLCKTHLTQFGCRIDWRRQFVTTDANPYYDAFVRWQMNRLKELNKVKFGKRYTIYSVKDGQPCMDHDRSEGEALNPQEYTAVKLKVLEFAPKFAEAIKGKIPDGSTVFMVAGTLRPETMYGQTCVFVGPKLSYGLFRGSEKEYYVMTARAAKNCAWQGAMFKNDTIPEGFADLEGSAMVGSLVHAPLSVHGDGVRVLPMETVLATKGTGVVTSVPSDSPDDFATVTELAKKHEYYGIKKEWAEKEIIPIIDTPSYGNLCAPFLVKKLKIGSPKDTKQLIEAKELAYKEGYYQGTMLVGSFKGEKVEVAKPGVRKALLDAGEAFPYAEPEGRVVSRSGDECIVALLDQWYLDYGEESWRKQALEFVENADGNGLNTFGPEGQHAFKGVLNWLNQWACARTYGLGSKLPWDHTFLVESLSDSTIYMSYYTIAHYLHSDNFGRSRGLGDIGYEQMTDAVFDYIFCHPEYTKEVESSGIPQKTLEKMRREWEYFYPLDMRVSGKDLIPNHLTFFLYNHIALFSREYWPRSIRTNGHLLLNGEKMSKSTGNFLTLEQVVAKYGADAARVAMADAGDGISDSNFEEDVADATVLVLFTKRELFQEIMKDESQLRGGELNDFQDALFSNEIHQLVREAHHHYSKTDYKLALQSAWFSYAAALTFYKEACVAAGIKMHKGLISEYMELQALVMAPIAPHWAEFIWLEILKKAESIQLAPWPEVPAVDASLTAAREYVRTTTSGVTSGEAATMKKRAKGKETQFDPRKPKKLTIYTTKSFPAWQPKYMDLLKTAWDPATKSVKDDKELMAKVSKMGEMKKAMPFIQHLKKRLAVEDASAVLEQKLAFDEQKILLSLVPGIKRTSGFQSVDVVLVVEGGKKGINIADGDKEVDVTAQTAESAVPGTPTFTFENVGA